MTTSSSWSGERLLQFHRRFLRMRHTKSDEERRRRAFLIVDSPASRLRMWRACHAHRNRLGRPLSWISDVFQEANLLLVCWISAVALAYEDRGPLSFAAWYWAACQRAANRSWKRVAGDERVAIEPLGAHFHLHAPEPSTEEELLWDDVLDELTRIPDARVRAAMADMIAEIPISETAERTGISVRDLFRLRSRGKAHLRKKLGIAAARE